MNQVLKKELKNLKESILDILKDSKLDPLEKNNKIYDLVINEID